MLAVALAAMWSAPSGHAQTTAAVPTPSPIHEDLADAATQLESTIAALRSDDLDAARRIWRGDAGPLTRIRAVQDRLADLYPQDGALLVEFVDSLDTAFAAGNATDALALAQALKTTLDDLLPRLAEYERSPTYVGVPARTVPPETTVTVPVLVGSAPADGFAAYEVTVQFDPTVLHVEEIVETLGQGASNLDNGVGEVKISGFVVQGLLELGPNAPATQQLAAVRVRAVGSTGATTALTIDGPALFADDGGRIPTQGVDGELTIVRTAGEATSSTGVVRYLVAAAVVLAGGAALWVLRRSV